MGNIPRSDKIPPEAHLAQAMVSGPDEAIVGQERSGGQALRTQNTNDWVQLPAEMKGSLPGQAVRFTSAHDVWEFQDLGFQIHQRDLEILMDASAIANDRDVDFTEREERKRAILDQLEDPLFVRMKLPRGWSMEDAGHRYGYWTYIMDEKGFRRVAIFYKAAFYDRNAHMGIDSCPRTAAQDEAVSAWREAKGWGGVNEPHWSMEHQQSEEDGTLKITYKRYQYPKHTEKCAHAVIPQFILGRAVLFVDPDGTLEVNYEDYEEQEKLLVAWQKEYAD